MVKDIEDEGWGEGNKGRVKGIVVPEEQWAASGSKGQRVTHWQITVYKGKQRSSVWEWGI